MNRRPARRSGLTDIERLWGRGRSAGGGALNGAGIGHAMPAWRQRLP